MTPTESEQTQTPPSAATSTYSEDAVLITLEADYAPDGNYGRRTLEVTPKLVRVIEDNGAVSVQIPIDEIKSARNEPMVGGGRMEVTAKTGAIIPVIAYSLTVAAKFSEAARGIEQLAKGEELSITLKDEKTRCPKCGRLLPEKDGVCPACVNRSATLARILGYLAPYRNKAISLALLSVLTTCINITPPWIQGQLVDKVLTPHKDLRLLFELVGLWLLILSTGSALQVINTRLSAFLGGSIAADIRSSVYRAVEFLQLSYFDKKQVGAIASRVTQDTDRVQGFLVDGAPFVVSNILMVIGVMGFIFHISWILALCILAPVPVVITISVTKWKTVMQGFMRVGQKWARLHMHLNESLSGIRVVKAFAREDEENEKFLSRNYELRDAIVKSESRWATISQMLMFCTTSGALINWAVGGYLVYSGHMTLGTFWRVVQYLGLIYGPLQFFAQVNSWYSRAMAGAERVFEVIDTEPENYRHDAVNAPILGEVTFKNVRFGYDKSNPVLKGINFTAKPGDMIGLVGKSGSGKSTTINLLCRFYEPDSGTISIDGIDYRDMSLKSMRSQVGIVLQEPFLFNGTVGDNIAYGKPGAAIEEIMEAAKAANAHHFILDKPDGYDTMVGERGSKLSGGERQRISIARAILHNPRILILDEATSSVDVETEKQIQEAIGRLIQGRTTFAIAHRLSTLRNATKLIVLEKGEIAEMGSHAELMEKEGAFYNLVQTQSQINEIIGYSGA